MTQIPGLKMSLERALSLCAYCPKMCHAVCPVYLADKRESHSPWGKMWQGYRAIVHGEKLDANAVALFEFCTGCGACTGYCEHGVEVADVLHFLRGHFLSSGLRDNTEQVLADFAADARQVGSDFLDFSRQKHAERLLWAGSDSGALRPGLAAMSRDLLRGLSIDVDLLEPESYPDLGQELYWTGQVDRFRQHAQQVAASVRSWEQLICLEPDDAFLLSAIYPKFGVDLSPQILSLVEVLDLHCENLPRLNISAPRYHDPASLARHLGQIEAPRRIIKQVCGQAAGEFVWHQGQCMSAGTGAGLELQYPELAKNMARQRWADRGPDEAVLVTASPKVEALFLRADIVCINIVEWISAETLDDVQALVAATTENN